MSPFLMLNIFKNSLFFCGNMLSSYGFNLISLSDVILYTLKDTNRVTHGISL